MKTELVLFALVVGIIATSGCLDGQEAPDVPEDDFEEPEAPEEGEEGDVDEETLPDEGAEDDEDDEALPE